MLKHSNIRADNISSGDTVYCRTILSGDKKTLIICDIEGAKIRCLTILHLVSRDNFCFWFSVLETSMLFFIDVNIWGEINNKLHVVRAKDSLPDR